MPATMPPSRRYDPGRARCCSSGSSTSRHRHAPPLRAAPLPFPPSRRDDRAGRGSTLRSASWSCVFSVAGRVVVCVVIGLRLLLGREEIELIVGLMTASARQLLEDGVQTYLSVVDLRGQRIALRLQCGAFFASLFEFYAGRFAFGARLCELFFECEARFVVALADLDQPADVL